MDRSLHRYDVALSFSGADRDLARELALCLHKADFRVFFDEFEGGRLLGKDLTVELQQVYEHESRFAVVLVSEEYVKGTWTQHERRSILSRAVHHDSDYILPVQVDGTALPGLPEVVAHVDLKRHSIAEVCRVIAERLDHTDPRAVSSTAPPEDRRHACDAVIRLYPRNFLGLVAQSTSNARPTFNLDCHVVNVTDSAVTVRHLEAFMTPPGSADLQLVWTLIYGWQPGGAAMAPVSDPPELRLQASQSALVGIQFAGPSMPGTFQWAAGTHDLEIIGWVNRTPRHRDVDLRTRFEFVTSSWESAEFARWTGAQEHGLRGLGGNDNAVAIPVSIDQGTLAVA